MDYEVTVREIKGLPQGIYRVSLFSKEKNDIESEYTVHVDESYVKKLGLQTDAVPELLRVSFVFLLAHEPADAILKEFNLRIIQEHFSEYESEMKKWWGG